MSDFDSLLKPIFIEGLQTVGGWYKSDRDYFLRSVFDLIGFKRRGEDEKEYYVPPFALSTRIVYPLKGDSKELQQARKDVLREIDEKYQGFSEAYLAGLTATHLFFLLEKFGGSVPVDEQSKVCVFDSYKIKAAQTVIKFNREELGHGDNLLINIDLSGIQRFIYNIVSTGALKNLRARSFFIELLCNHMVLRVLRAYDLHYANVLMNGGGSIYILSGSTGSSTQPEEKLDIIGDGINRWLLKEFDGMLYASFAYVRCTDNALQDTLASVFDDLALKSFEAKQTKFKSIIEKGEFEFLEEKDPMYPGCEICNRDDARVDLKPVVGNAERLRCALCERLLRLGSRIPSTRFIYEGKEDAADCLKIEDTHYLLSDTPKSSPCVFAVHQENEAFFNCLKDNVIPIFTGTFIRKNKELPKKVYEEIEEERMRFEALVSESGREADEELESLKDDSTATLEYMAKSSKGAKLLAALRMDADNLGKIMHMGFRDGSTLEGISSLSRNLNYFFKLHLESICRDGIERDAKDDIFAIERGRGRNVHVIYAGGDDLFALGAWSDTAFLAIDVGEAFMKYTCNNIDVGLSGGLTLHHDKFPVSKMAEASLAGLACAKNNFQPCWMCRDNWMECPLYDLGHCLRKDSLSMFYTGHMAFRKKKLDEMHKPVKYSEEASRLRLALKWKFCDTSQENVLNVVNEVNDYVIEPLKAFREKGGKVSRGFFHNVLSLLDAWYDDGLTYLPKIVWILQKFKGELKKNITKSEEGQTLYDLYDMYLHLHDSKRFSTLYLPLSWNILLTKGENRDEV